MTDVILKDLNAEQQEAVTATEGPVLVLAGAGSGKTRVLTHRIAYMLRKGLAGPEHILAVTFTNKAAGEMKQRIERLLENQSHLYPSGIGTFHRIGVRILREQARHLDRSAGFAISDQRDSEHLVKQALQELSIPRREWSPRQALASISKAKNEGLGSEDLLAASQSTRDEALARTYRRYQALLKRNNAYDFDDLLVTPVRLLQTVPDVRQWYQQLWRFLSVDEYQDTNSLQHALITLLLSPDRHICAVGDDYQTIYSWRGAKVEHILRFEQDFPDCRVIYLTQNYRSTPAILTVANRVIAENRQQKHKKLWTDNKDITPVRLATLPSDQMEASWLRRQIEAHKEKGGSLRDILVLYRTNAQSRLLEEEFLSHRIPYTIVGGFRFYERREIKDAIAFLQLWNGGQSSVSLYRISEALWPGIGEKTLQRFIAESETRGLTLLDLIKEKAGSRQVMSPVARAFTQTQAMSFTHVAELLERLLSLSGYTDWLNAQLDGAERLENIDELLNVTSQYVDVPSFLEQVALINDLDQLNDQSTRVTCMTLHAAKGLEFAHVFLLGCEEGLLPHQNSLDTPSQVEEERRLLYVGITRAKTQLTLTHAERRFIHGSSSARAPSRFLQPITNVVESLSLEDTGPAQHALETEDSFYDFAGEGDLSTPTATRVGTFVRHPQFGQGVVIEHKGSVLTCIFEGSGLKTIDAFTIERA